ncbi:hypothetical protein J6I90_12400 [Pseudidiomarina sp. 1APP75-32.1]|uniref:histidine kinase n=1 Tax=Pseudidiomarina terrestris TaxID=2820060 RepID=A0AAW7R0N0_9GAMM|nr:ATP-binding protein [Pseudidiomarina sp. 1APP75-32.1]MDN7125683.1 hypothetical protein [Pseudidiomarina sp. 1APP75-32.1]
MKWKFAKLITLLVILSAFLYISFSELIAINDDDSGRYFVAVDDLIAPNSEISQLTVIEPEELSLPSAASQQLAKGETIQLKTRSGELFYYKYLPDGNLLKLGPVFETRQDDTWLLVLVISFYLGLVTIALVLIWPVFRDLHGLQQQAIRFGQDPKPLSKIISDKSAIAPLAQTFHRMSRQIVRLVSVHKTLSQVISHEVRTPLARLRFALALQKPNENPHLEQMLRDLDEIEQLATSYLTFARLDYLRKRQLRPIPLAAFVNDISTSFAIYRNEFKIDCIAEGSILYGEQQALKIVCQNLISNALRYARSQVKLLVHGDAEYASISIQDDGPGFPDGADPFGKFEQAEQQPSGFGLGLFIVQQLSLWHGATIKTSLSEELGGAMIIITWPCSASPNPVSLQRPPEKL